MSQKVEVINIERDDIDCSYFDMNLKRAIFDHASVSSKIGMVTCGGMNNINGNLVFYHECYLDYSKYFPPMNSARQGYGMELVDDELYVIGGYYGLDSLEKINITKGTIGNSWKREYMNFSITGHCVIRNGDSLWVIGGTDDYTDPSLVSKVC